MNERNERNGIRKMKKFNNKNTDGNYTSMNDIFIKSYCKSIISVDEMRNAKIVSLMLRKHNEIRDAQPFEVANK